MTSRDESVEAVIRGLGFTHCPTCQTTITVATVTVGWNTKAEDVIPLGPRVWLTCTRCATHLKFPYLTAYVQSWEEAIKALKDA